MQKEMNGKIYPDLLERMAQFELTLLDWAEEHKGARKYVAFADKCWPAFPEQFGFEYCYVKSRLARLLSTVCSVTAMAICGSYIAEGEVLSVAARSFGGIGIFDIPEMGRFYRHVLIQKRYPHHGAVAFAHCGKALFEVFKYFGVADITYNQPKSLPYPTENPFA